jgi:predicted heme/steroid binding protein/uncharacterized membrane protein
VKEFTPEELSRFNGASGEPVYVAHQGRIFDLSASKLWKGGMHMKRHHAGGDLTTDIQAAPHTPEVLGRFPHVGILKQEPVVGRQIPALLSRILGSFPILRRHPHPMVVHFPIAFTFSSAAFMVLYLITGIRSFENTAWHCLGGGVIFTPVAMVTGWFTWWLNYLARPMRAVTIKTWCSIGLFVLQVTVFAWKMLVPDILNSTTAASIVYGMMTISLVPLVTVIGWFGATMTFPVEKE